jgi:hypothetical protein
MKLLLLNQFDGTSSAPTGRILQELGDDLAADGHEIVVITTSDRYGKPVKGKARMIREAKAHLQLLWRGLWQSKVDAVISLTSPAFLPVTAALISLRHRARHYHWAMDLYPEVALILGEPVPCSGFFKRLMGLAYRHAAKVVALDEDMRDHILSEYGTDSAVIGPTPPEITWPAAKSSGKAWLYSGNFGRAHDIEVLLEAQKRLEASGSPAWLILQGNGPQFLKSRDWAREMGLKQVMWNSPVALTSLGKSLLEADVLVVTRKPELKGILLPSKLILAELSGRSVLWIGDTDGKTAQRLREGGRHGVFTVAEVDGIATWLQEVFSGRVPAQEPIPVDRYRAEISRHWKDLVAQND